MSSAGTLAGPTWTFDLTCGLSCTRFPRHFPERGPGTLLTKGSESVSVDVVSSRLASAMARKRDLLLRRKRPSERISVSGVAPISPTV